jgi:serine/threonine protein kinase
MVSSPHNVYETSDQIPLKHVKNLGSGAFGIVDRVERAGNIYARKTFTSRTGKSLELESVLGEVKVARSLTHDHVVRLVETYQLGTEPDIGEYAIIMEPVAEGNLATYLSRLDEVPVVQDNGLREQLTRWFYCLTTAVAYLHSAGIIHRDIKPQNILTLHGNILVTDFGISQEFQDLTISETTDTLGSRLYRSPELANKRRSGRREDIFSLGAVFLEILTVYSGPGQLAKLRDYRQGSYCQNLDKIDRWIHGLLLAKYPSWHHIMLNVCALMIEEERTKRPYAIDLLNLWEYDIHLPGGSVLCLPRGHTTCAPDNFMQSRKSCASWSQALRSVSTFVGARSKWLPGPQEILPTTDPSPPTQHLQETSRILRALAANQSTSSWDTASRTGLLRSQRGTRRN